MTREEWLRHAVEELDTAVFNGSLRLFDHNYQISMGKTKSTKPSEAFYPYEGEDVKIDDFFPPTVIIDHTIQEPGEMLAAIAFECIHVFFGEHKNNKAFKKLAKKYYFDAPYTSPHPSDYLKDLLNEVYSNLAKLYGAFPGRPVVIHPKEQKEKKKSVFTAFCPDCGYEVKISKKMLDKYQGTLPSCPCGAKMGLDLEEDKDENELLISAEVTDEINKNKNEEKSESKNS